MQRVNGAFMFLMALVSTHLLQMLRTGTLEILELMDKYSNSIFGTFGGNKILDKLSKCLFIGEDFRIFHSSSQTFNI